MRNLAVNPSESGKLLVSWAEPNDRASNPCRPRSYYVAYRLENRGQCLAVRGQTVAISVTETEILLDGLRAHSTYSVTVIPSNDAGNGTARSSAGTTLETSKHSLLH